MKGTIVFYVVSPVHLRNSRLLSAGLDGWQLRLAYERESAWLDAAGMADSPFEPFAFGPGAIPDKLWEGEVRAVVFSTLQPRRAPVALLAEALRRSIPTVGIEESNQIALNNGGVNNYLLPADYVLVASEYERRWMVEDGFPESRFEVTGWPFYEGRIGKNSSEQKRASKKALGLDTERRMAALTLTALHNAGTTPESRRRELRLAAEGLPKDFQLAIKPHPIENLETLLPFVRECAPQAVPIDGLVPARDLLAATDILLNRGASQVCFEALWQEIPVVVLDTGIDTPFHRAARETVVENAGELHRMVERCSQPNYMDIYAELIAEHMPFPPDLARRSTCGRIAEAAERGAVDPDRGRQWFDLALFQAWVGEGRSALAALARDWVSAAEHPVESLVRLVEYRADRADLERLAAHIGPGFRSHLLRSLWIEQLSARKTNPAESDIHWMETFPPANNPMWFFKTVKRWAYHLARSCGGEQATAYVDRVDASYPFVPEYTRLASDMRVYLSGWSGRAKIAAKNTALDLWRRLARA